MIKRRGLMRRRWLLPAVLMMILVPTLAALLFSSFGLYQQRRAMVTMAERYAQGLARSIAQESSTLQDATPLQRHRRMGMFIKMLALGPPVPGWVATAGPGGIKLQGSPGSNITPALAAEIQKSLADGQMRTATLISDKHPPSAAAICPYPDGIRAVVVVISHYLVPGPMMRLITHQPLVSICVLLVALAGIFLLWRWCVTPLRRLAQVVENTNWGREVAKLEKPGPLSELCEMTKALKSLSVGAVEREELKKNYVNDIVRTQEEERTHLAREIHDSPLQTVSSMIQRIQLAERGLSRETIDKERVVSHLELAREAAMTAVQDMRDVCDRLSPPWLSLGMVRATEEISNRLSRIHNITINSSVTGETDNLTEKDVLALCRIIQEAVANAARHGGATSVDVKFDGDAKPRRLTVRDNGCGITDGLDVELLRVQGHRGIAGMNERATLIGGTFAIRSAEGGGTEVVVELPDSPKS